MPRAKKRPARARKPKTATALARDLAAVKAEVKTLREQWTKTNRTLLRLCCPKKWFEEEIDEEQLWSDAVWEPSLRAVIDSLK
jgi:hypothetical protein